jgi:heme-degrading monooxygenase HmoA
MVGTSAVKVVIIVKFRSRLSADEIKRRYRERMPEFRQLPGLVQKYYFHDDSTGEWGGIYLWDSQESVEEYLASDLRQTIPAAYEIDGAPQVERLLVMDTLRS